MDDTVGVADARGDRFLHVHVEPALQCGQRHGCVQMVGGGEDDGVEVGFLLQQLLQTTARARLVGFGGDAGGLQVEVGHRHQVGPRVGGDGFHMAPANAAYADDGGSECAAHAGILLSR
jgi:hypothetical protein